MFIEKRNIILIHLTFEIYHSRMKEPSAVWIVKRGDYSIKSKSYKFVETLGCYKKLSILPNVFWDIWRIFRTRNWWLQNLWSTKNQSFQNLTLLKDLSIYYSCYWVTGLEWKNITSSLTVYQKMKFCKM